MKIRGVQMYKILAVASMFLLMVGCDEQKQYKQAVFEQMQAEKDLVDYGVDIEDMTSCVVDKSSKSMPGFAPFEPMRKQAYSNYQKMLQLTKSQDAKKTMEELRQAFGSAKGLADAHANYSEAVVECMTSIITSGEKGLVKHDKK